MYQVIADARNLLPNDDEREERRGHRYLGHGPDGVQYGPSAGGQGRPPPDRGQPLVGQGGGGWGGGGMVGGVGGLLLNMVRRLVVKGGHHLIAGNRSSGKVDEAVAAGAEGAYSVEE